MFFNRDKLYLVAKLAGHQFDDFGIQTLVDTYNNTEVKTSSDYIYHRDVHYVGQFLYRDEFGYL